MGFKAENAKYYQWVNESNFENCKLNRGEYGRFLASYITGEKNGFVLNLDGSWGSGKTEFLKRLYSHLLENDHPVIYIDAWESDFSDNPLTVVSSELISQIQLFCDVKGASWAEVQRLFGKVLKASVVGVAGYASKQLLNDASIGSGVVQNLISSDPRDFLDSLKKNHIDQVETIQKIRVELGQVAEQLKSIHGAELPVVVLVDELDRCRPTYAIEMLEVIKHFFNTSNFVFVVATDTTQLCHSIKAIYGDGFESGKYLRRFFDRKASLPAPEISNYLTAKDISFTKYSTSLGLSFFPKTSINRLDFSYYLCLVSDAYELQIRDVDQLVAKLESCLRLADSMNTKRESVQIINLPVLLIALIEFENNSESFFIRTNDTYVKIYPPKKVTISGSVTFEFIFNFCMRSIIDNKAEKDFLRDSIKGNLENPAEKGFDVFFRDLIGALPTTNMDEKYNYWRWNDYAKMAQLSGHIE